MTLRRVTGAAALVVALCAPAAAQSTAQLRDYLKKNYQTPEDYVLAKFVNHDLVLLGEPHWIRQHVNLVHDLIPLLYQHGIHTLAIEFARRVDQPLADSVVMGKTYSETGARTLLMRELPEWGYQEYADLYKAAWELNQSLPAGAPRFRILGLNNAPRWDIIKTDAEFEDWRIRYAATRGEGEEVWAKLLLDSVLARGEKALVYTGLHHAFTKYAQPIVDRDGKLLRTTDERFGQALYRAVPDRIFMITFNAPWYGPETYGRSFVLPAHGAIEAVIRQLDKPHQRAGFDLVRTPFGALTDDHTVYRKGHEPFTLEKLADGFIILGPIADYQPVHAIPDFINAGNIDAARRLESRPSERNKTIEQFNSDIASSLSIIDEWRKVKN